MEQLKRLRTARGLSQARLAARAEIDPSTVNQIERGAREASPATLRKLAEALEVGIADLLESESPKARSISPEAPESRGGVLPEAESPWKTQYEEYGHTLFDKWEGELEEKIALVDTSPAAFFDWVQEVRTFGSPFVRGLVAAYSSADSLSLAAVSGVGAFLRDWSDLWHRIEEITTLSPDDQRRLLEMAEEARSLTSLDGNE